MDRGLVDVLGYLTLCDLHIPRHVAVEPVHYRYHDTIFLAPFSPEIYAQDAERKQDFQEAEHTATVMALVYRHVGYAICGLPKSNVATRADFILHHLPPHLRKPN